MKLHSKSINLSLLIVIATLVSHSAQANLGDAYGFGSRSAALAGATASHGADAFASYINPAMLANQPQGKRFVLGWGMIYMQPEFDDIKDVVIENRFTSDKTKTGAVNTDYRPTFGQVVGLAFDLIPSFYHFSAGLSVFSPADRIAYLDTGELYVPEYVLYRARTHRPQLDAALAIQPLTGLSFGAGVHIGFSLSSNATGFLATSANKTSSLRFSSSVKPKASPYFGVHYSSLWSAGLVVRLPAVSDNNLTLNTGAQFFGDTAAPQIVVSSQSALFYDPLSVELGFSIPYMTLFRTYLQLDYQAWGRYQAPANIIKGDSSEGITITQGREPEVRFRNILIPRVGQEVTLDRHTVRAGYAYRPGITDGPPNKNGNLLDPSKHVLSAGYGIKFDRFLGVDAPWSIDAHASYHSFVKQTIKKADGNEVGTAGDSKIGAPGYQAGGKIYGGGVSLTLML